jgi:hypothetical protein
MLRLCDVAHKRRSNQNGNDAEADEPHNQEDPTRWAPTNESQRPRGENRLQNGGQTRRTPISSHPYTPAK